MKTLKNLIIAGVMLTAFGCSEESTGSGICGSGANLCFDLDGSSVSVNAHMVTINSSRFRLLWEDSSSGYKNIEIDLYGPLTTGTYTVSSNPSADGEAGFQYYINASGMTHNYDGTSGNITITDTNPISGTFELAAIDQVGSTTHSITNGNIDAVQ